MFKNGIKNNIMVSNVDLPKVGQRAREQT